MRNLRTFSWGVGALVICAGLAALKSGMAQETTPNRDDQERDAAITAELTFEDERRETKPPERDGKQRGERGRGGMGPYGGYGGEYGGRGMSPYGPDGPGGYGKRGLPGIMHQIREAAAALSQAEDDEAREDAERTLNELLNEYFEEDMKRREEELANVERRVKELRDLLERRREKKEDIIELQVEVLRNQAVGLGFFSEPQAGGPKDVFHIRLNEPFGATSDALPGRTLRVQQAMPPAQLPQPPQPAVEPRR